MKERSFLHKHFLLGIFRQLLDSEVVNIESWNFNWECIKSRSFSSISLFEVGQNRGKLTGGAESAPPGLIRVNWNSSYLSNNNSSYSSNNNSSYSSNTIIILKRNKNVKEKPKIISVHFFINWHENLQLSKYNVTW